MNCHNNSLVVLNNVSNYLQYMPNVESSHGFQHCVIWKSGYFVKPLSKQNRQAVSLQLDKLSPIDSYSTNFTFVNETWFNPYSVYDSRYVIPWLSSHSLRSAIDGLHFVFHGDSMIRQLFTRMIWHIRGYDIIIEQGFHRNALYTFNSTHDMLSIDLNDGKLEAVDYPKFTAEFFWVHNFVRIGLLTAYYLNLIYMFCRILC